MLNVIVENKYGEQLNLSTNTDYQLLQVTGLTPAGATINTSKMANKDGDVFNSSSLDKRNIVMIIAPRGNVESSRINLYKYIKSKQYIKLYLRNGQRKVWIEGRVESIEGDLYENPQKLQVSVICPDPHFKDDNVSTTDFSSMEDTFTFPFDIDSTGVPLSTLSPYTEKNILNYSDDETGVVIELYARDLVLEPTIYDLTTNESFTIEYEMRAGDKIILNTNRGEKSLKLISNGVESNIINSMVKGSKWFNLITGDNIFSYSCLHGIENLSVLVTLQPIYEGV